MNRRKTRKKIKGGYYIQNFRKNYLNLYANSLNKTKKRGENSRTGLNMDKVQSNYQRFMHEYINDYKRGHPFSPSNDRLVNSAEVYANTKIMKQRYSYYILILENLIDEYLFNYVFYSANKNTNYNNNNDLDENQSKKNYYEKYGRNPDNDAVEYAIRVMDILIKNRYISYNFGPSHPYTTSKYKIDTCRGYGGTYHNEIQNSNNDNVKICKEVNNIKNKIAKQILNPSFLSRFF